MTPRTEALFASAVLAALLAGCGGGDFAARSAANLPPFCQEVLPASRPSSAGFSTPKGSDSGGRPSWERLGRCRTG